MSRASLSVAAGAFALLSTVAATSAAAEPWIDRPMTLHRLVFAGDVGIGVGHYPNVTGGGMNLGATLGVTERFELGLRTGVRFGDDGRATHADEWARTNWTETYGTGFDTAANPELRLRWVAYTGDIAEVGLDARMYLPVETNTKFGVMFGVPLALHVSNILRIDTGAYVPLVFYDPTFSGFSFPAYFWFQASPKVWLGPMFRLSFIDPGPGDYRAHLLLGFGLGYQVANSVDLKAMFTVPNVDDDGGTRGYGAGFGVQFRLGE